MKVNRMARFLWIGMALIFGLSSSWISAAPAPHSGRTWYVAPNGSDQNGDGSPAHPFRTLQWAIDRAADGDRVIAAPGRYAGPGNVPLDFQGKAITVRSTAPDDPDCARITVLDGAGAPAIARFVHDEGPGTALEGFTLLAGIPGPQARGIPGFFEFSAGARPRTAHLRLAPEPAETPRPASPAVPAGAPLPEDKAGTPRRWDGADPFHQPIATTDYYGSGDADNDGILSPADITMTQRIAAGELPPNIRADVDGDGTVTITDTGRISAALSGAPLPGWWDRLTTRAAREEWITRLMERDRTNQRAYQMGRFVCLNFAIQLHIHAVNSHDDLFQFPYNNAGPSLFNIPMYEANVNNTTYGHAINAVLVGDDPLNFEDWRFIEPQNDEVVTPGMWDMPYGTIVNLQAVPNIEGTWHSRIVFSVTQTGWTLQEVSPGLILTRTAPPPRPPDNRPDLWNPRVIPGESPALFFERHRDDLTRATDFYYAPLDDPAAGIPLLGDSPYSRLLDVLPDPDGTLHLLWKGEPYSAPGVYYGRFDPDTQQITAIQALGPDHWLPMKGRLILTAQEELHVFWLEGRNNSYDLNQPGIYTTHRTGTGWAPLERIADLGDYYGIGDWEPHEWERYTFDVTRAGSGLLLLWLEPRANSILFNNLKARRYDGTWNAPITLESGTLIRGVALETDSQGTYHQVYWESEWSAGRGPLFHRRSSDGTVWSTPELIDSDSTAGYPHLTAGPDAALHLVWEREVNGHWLPVYASYRNNQWGPFRIQGIRNGADAWYPQIALQPDGTPILSWSSRSEDWATVEWAALRPLPPMGYLPMIQRNSGP